MSFLMRSGIFSSKELKRALAHGRIPHRRVSLELLNVGDHPTQEQIETFEEISFRLRTSNGTYRTTFANRFHDLDEIVNGCLQKVFPADMALRVEDRAVSHALTSFEWVTKLFQLFPFATFEASDNLLNILKLRLPDDAVYIVEPDGQVLQYIKWPFVVSLAQGEPRRYPLNRWVARRAKRRFDELSLSPDWMDSSGYCQITKIPFVHPKAARLSREDMRFRLRERSVFDAVKNSCHVIRTMNILSSNYFSVEKLVQGVEAAFETLKDGGIWIVGRTHQADSTNHVTIFRKQQDRWKVVERLGEGSEIEELAMTMLPCNV